MGILCRCLFFYVYLFLNCYVHRAIEGGLEPGRFQVLDIFTDLNFESKSLRMGKVVNGQASIGGR